MPYYAFPCQADQGATSVVQTERGEIIARSEHPILAAAIAAALNSQAEHAGRADAFAGMLAALQRVNLRISQGDADDATVAVLLSIDDVSMIAHAIAAATAEDIPQPAPSLFGQVVAALRLAWDDFGTEYKGPTMDAIKAALAAVDTGQVPVDKNVPPSLLARCESFISGFEDDEMQEGIPELLADLRASIAGTPPVAETAPAEDDKATDEEWQAAHDLYGSDDIMIDDNAEASRGENGVWVQAWVLVPNQDED